MIDSSLAGGRGIMLEAGARALARMGSVAVEVRAQASKASEAAAVKDQETLVKGGEKSSS